MALANFLRMRKNAKMAACISQQRHVFEAAFDYTVNFDPPDGPMNVDVLEAAGYVPQNCCECTDSPIDDFDDYRIMWQDDLPIDVDCLVRGAEHDWQI